MSQYVCARITRMDDVDIALFEREWNNTLYYFILNADEQIYLRYGGRDSRGPMTYLDFTSLELALAKGLELHQRFLRGQLPKKPKPQPRFPREIPPLVERTFARGQCVECHLVGDYDLIHKEQTGTLNKVRDMFRWPDIRTLGIELDVPKGLVIKEVRDPARAAGVLPGDRLAALENTEIWTFGDFQYYFDKVPREAKSLRLTVERQGQMHELTLQLPGLWWVSDIRYRQLSVDPRAEFESQPLTTEEKHRLSLNPQGFAARVVRIGGFAEMLKVHELKVGDIIFAVDGAETDDIASTPELYIKLRKRAGDTVMVDVLRNGTRLRLPVHTQRMYFRK
jgi:hypothetical protein